VPGCSPIITRIGNDPDKYWTDVGKRSYGVLKNALRQNGEIRAAAETAVAGAANDEAKTLALISYIRSKVRNLYSRNVSESEKLEILKQMPKSRLRTSAEIFKSGIGDPSELNILFAAMCSSVGLDARPVMVSNRDDVLFDPSLTDEYFLPNVDMAVKIDGNWRLYDVSTRLLPPQMLGWREEGVKALVSDSKKPMFILSRLSPPEASASRRTGKFSLSAEGTLEGDVEETFTGHTAEDRRAEMEGQDSAKLAEDLKAKIMKLFPQAEVSTSTFEGVDDSGKPLVVRYHVAIPNYAQRTGKRILFQPLFFQRGEAPLFTSSERHYDVFFPYAWRESDEIRIKLPEGFQVDNGENPGNVDFGATGGYKLRLALLKPGPELIAERELVLGREGVINCPVAAYPQIKAAFEAVHSRDDVTLSLIAAAPASGSK
jgi:hypothetical protein